MGHSMSMGSFRCAPTPKKAVGTASARRLPLVVLLLIQIVLFGIEACASQPKSERQVSATEPTSKSNPEQSSMVGGSNKSQPAKRPESRPGSTSPGRAPAGAAASNNALDLDESREQQAFQQIVKQAKTGGIQYYVPPTMTVGTPASVTVEIYGANANPELQKKFQATGSGTLKVITPMLVLLTQPDNPGGFQIEPDPVQSGDQFLPDDGKTDWIWKVTPLQGGPKKLRIDAYMVLNAKLPNGQPMMRVVQSYTVHVPVKVKPRLQAMAEFFERNWDKLLVYVLPSGAVVLFLGWLFVGRKEKPAP